MSNQRKVYPDPDSAAQGCANHLASILDAAIQKNRLATMAISGGSTPKLMFAHIAKAKLDWSAVHLFWVDERAVPPNHPESNYRMAEEHLIRPAGIPARNLCRIQAELEPEAAASRYTEDVQEFFGVEPGDLPVFDAIHLGVGADAHTASLFPGQPKLDDREGIAAAVYVEKIPQWRITLLPGVLLAARQLAVLCAGADKAEALRQIWEQPFHALTYPAQIIAHRASNVTWFLDEAANSPQN